jgi:hypothetical protein
MNMIALEPNIDKQHKLAVALYTDKGIMMVIQTYPNMEELKTGYKECYDFARQSGLTKPLPIELIGETGKCHILQELLL